MKTIMDYNLNNPKDFQDFFKVYDTRRVDLSRSFYSLQEYEAAYILACVVAIVAGRVGEQIRDMLLNPDIKQFFLFFNDVGTYYLNHLVPSRGRQKIQPETTKDASKDNSLAK